MAQILDRNSAVLVVEDDPLLRMDAIDIIEDAGFGVYDATNADDGFRLLERHRDIAILFTDFDMPGSMDGLQLAHTVRRRWPPVAIVIASGHMIPSSEALPEESLFIPKPYSPPTLVKALTQMAGKGWGASPRRFAHVR